MNKLTTLWMMVLMLGMSIPAMGAMSMSKMRQNARFLTDRMAYELNLTPMQYDDVYEVNYDFIDNVRYIMDDVVRGYGYAVDRYCEFLDYRNDDLRWILSASQYRRFMGVDYFYRPIYTTASNWLFRIYRVYHDVNHFYFSKPHHYKSYKGGHYRTHFGNVSYYKHHRKDHYKHDFYQGNVRVHHEKPKARPNVQSRPPQDRKEMRTSTKRNAVRQQSRPERIKKEAKQDVRKEVGREVKKDANKRVKSESKSIDRKEVKNGARRRNVESSSRSSQKESPEGRRAVRNR